MPLFDTISSLFATGKAAEFAFSVPNSLAAYASSSVSINASAGCASDTIPLAGLPGTDQERTFLAIKPDGVDRGLVGKVLRRLEAEGLQIVGIKGAQPTKVSHCSLPALVLRALH